MERNPITMGDIAMSAVDIEANERRFLERRVDNLEDQLQKVYAWSEEVAKTLNDLA